MNSEYTIYQLEKKVAPQITKQAVITFLFMIASCTLYTLYQQRVKLT